MKNIFITLLILVFSLGLSAQENDSILLEKVDMLKKELGLLKKQNKNLQVKLVQLQKAHQKDMDETNKKFAATDEAVKQSNARTSDLEQSINESEEKTLESLTILGDWTKKMIMVLSIIALVLFVILFVLVLSNRKRILGDYKKLEAKVENTKDAIELEIREGLKRHEEDIKALKALVEKNKK